MGLSAIPHRLFSRRTLPILVINAVCGVAVAAETICIDTVEYRRLAQRYAELYSKFDLTTVAQEYVDVSVDIEDLKASITACRKNSSGTDQQQCEPAAKQYDAKMSRLKEIEDRFYAALNMQEYLLTLKLKLEQPQCAK